MRLTTKGRFAVTAMIDLALREHSGPVALAAISSLSCASRRSARRYRIRCRARAAQRARKAEFRPQLDRCVGRDAVVPSGDATPLKDPFRLGNFARQCRPN